MTKPSSIKDSPLKTDTKPKVIGNDETASQKVYQRGLVIFQRDLRLNDQQALAEALRLCERVVLLAIFDPYLHKLPIESHQIGYERFNLRTRLGALKALEEEALAENIALKVVVGDSAEIIHRLVALKTFDALFLNEVYEPKFLNRHKALEDFAQGLGIGFHLLRDHEVVPEHLLINGTGGTYKIFTPFYNKWRSLLSMQSLMPWVVPLEHLKGISDPLSPSEFSSLQAFHQHWLQLDFEVVPIDQTSAQNKLEAFLADGLAAYKIDRDYPSLEGTSALSPELNNGVIAYRTVVRRAYETPGGEAFLRQLAWKHFYMLLIKNHPEIEDTAFLPCFRALPWLNKAEYIEAWKEGKTGIPIVDSAMLELKAQGTMHNRLRMICASLLVKQLDTDWRIGEAYFYEFLKDGDLALNNGGWQWCASTGTDAQPYFRIFNPLKQQETYDANRVYTSRWLDKERLSLSPIIDLKITAQQAKLKYQIAKKGEVADENSIY